MPSGGTRKEPNRYAALIEKIFFDHWRKGSVEFLFARNELQICAKQLQIKLPDNLGDVIYSFRFRSQLPQKILETQPEGKEWRIELAGKSRYRFVLGQAQRILPRQDLLEISIPNATPELIGCYALDDEQALLAIVRYNRLLDIFLGITTYSLQSHLRTTVKEVGQIEIDELYVGVDKHGCHYVIPVQAKGGSDQISGVQTKQDIRACTEKFPGIRCCPISVQFIQRDVVAMFLLAADGDGIKVVEERHYKLVPADDLDRKAITAYRPHLA
jgi:hypothetical protein